MSYAYDMPTSTKTAELASSLRVSVTRVSRRLRYERNGATDLSLGQLATLGTLDRHGPLTPRELADHEKIQPPSMTRILGALEERDLIVRTPHETDGRQHLVSLTPAAKNLLREDRRRRDAWLARQLAELTDDERAVLRAALPVFERLAKG